MRVWTMWYIRYMQPECVVMLRYGVQTDGLVDNKEKH